MLAELHANASKGPPRSWRRESVAWGLAEVRAHVQKLQRAVEKGGPSDVREHAAAITRAARPVGAASTGTRPRSCRTKITALSTVVFPRPAPPVSTHTGSTMHRLTAAHCSSESLRLEVSSKRWISLGFSGSNFLPWRCRAMRRSAKHVSARYMR